MYVLQFMEQENSTPLVQFWLTADSFRSQLSDPLHVPNIDRDTADAMGIYERCDSSLYIVHHLIIMLQCMGYAFMSLPNVGVSNYITQLSM